MAFLSRTVLLAAALAGGTGVSQLPEFSQQYQQRLGGALEELRVVVADFDADAERAGLTRTEAIDSYGRSDDLFLRDRGQSMRRAMIRYERLQAQRALFEDWPDAVAPLAIMRHSDAALLAGTWDDFRPAVPATLTGAAYAGAGAVGGWLVMAVVLALLSAASGRLRGRSHRAPKASGR